MDPAVELAIATALGRRPPFTGDDCASLESLSLRRAAGFDGLETLSGLRRLAIVACGGNDLRPLVSLPRLRSLVVACTPVVDLRPLASCQELEDLELLFTAAEDLEPVLEIPKLRRVRLLGNPWSETSFHQTRARLWRDRPHGPVVTEFSSRDDWELTRELRAAGMPLSYSHIDGLRPVLVRPGFGVFPDGDVDWAPAVRTGVRYAVSQPGFTAEALLRAYAGSDEQQRERQFDAAARVVMGDRDDALRWITGSTLSAEDRAALETFVARFPELTFFRENGAVLAARMDAPRQRVELPAWFRDLRDTLAGVLPGAEIAVQFDAYEGYCLREDSIDESWHTLALWGYGFDEQRKLLERDAGVYPVGNWTDTWQSTLAISLSDQDDTQIYEFFEQDITELRAAGRPPREGMLPVFRSYASMLGHVIAIQVDGEIVIRARR